MSEPYITGNTLRRAAAFANAAGAAADPSTVTYKYRKPGSATVTSLVYGTDAEVVKDSTGNYHVDLELDTGGIWTDWWVTTGTPKKTTRGTFAVQEAGYA